MRDNQLQQRLSQLNDLQQELFELSNRICELQGYARSKNCEDQCKADLEETANLMEARKAECAGELRRLYAYIDGIPDSKLRRIFAYRYIDGKTWLQIAFCIGEHDEQRPRKLHDRYISKNPCFEKSDRDDA